MMTPAAAKLKARRAEILHLIETADRVETVRTGIPTLIRVEKGNFTKIIEVW